MCYVWTSIADVSVHLPHHANVLVAIEQGIFLVPAPSTSRSMRSLVCFETGVGENYDQSLSILVRRRNGRVLLRDEVRQFW